MAESQMLTLILAAIEKDEVATRENRDAIAGLKEVVDRGMVGRENCDIIRARCNERMLPIEEACQTFRATRGGFIDRTELHSAIKASMEATIVPIAADLQAIKDERRLAGLTWKLIWGNPVLRWLTVGLLGGAYVGGLGAIGVYWGRVGQYGWHLVAAFLVTFVFITIGIWMARRDNREITKKETKRLMGM
jgi:hypothetical protein